MDSAVREPHLPCWRWTAFYAVKSLALEGWKAYNAETDFFKLALAI